MEQPQSPRPSGIRAPFAGSKQERNHLSTPQPDICHVNAPAGGIGEMSTPEMLAKREQRRRMEAQAAALSRTSLSRRLLQPLQPQQRHASHQQPQQQLPNSLSGLASQPSGRSNMFSRAGLKRPAAAALAPAPAPKAAAENAGVSAEELAKLMEDESTEDPRAAAPVEDVSCAKRPKLSDLLQQQQQQNNASTGGAGKPCFLTLQRQDQTTSVSAAFGRVAAQRQQQVGPERLQAVLPQQEEPQVSKQQDFVQHSINQQDAHQDVQMTTVDNRQQQQLMLQPSTTLEEPQAMAPVNTTVTPAVAATAAATGTTGVAPLEAAAAAGAGPAAAAAPAAVAMAGAATAGAAAIPPLVDTSKRWLYVKPGSKPAAEQQAEPEPPTAAAGTGRRKQAASKAAQSKGSKPNQGSSGRSTTTARRKASSNKAVAPVAAGSTDGAHDAAGQQPAAAAADADADADADAGAAGAPPAAAAAAARPPRPRRAATTRQSNARSAAAAACDSSAPELDSSSSSSGSDGGSSSDSGDDVTDELETRGKRGGRLQRKGRVVKGKAAAGADPAPSSRRAGGAAAAAAGKGAAKPRAARRSSRATQQQAGALQPPAPPRCTAKLSKQLQPLQDAVSNSRRVQQLSAAMLQEDDEQQQQQHQHQQRDRPAAAGRRQPAGLATTHNRLLKQQQQLSSGAQQQARSAGQQQQPALQSHLPPELAAKVQAAIAAKPVPAAATAAAAAVAGAAADSDGDLVLLDESDDLEIMDAAPGTDTELLSQQHLQDVPLTQQQQQQQEEAALKAEGLPGCGDMMGVDDADVDMQLLEGSGSEGEGLSGELCEDDFDDDDGEEQEEQEGGSSSSGWGYSGGSEGATDEEWDGEEPDDEEGGEAGDGGCSAGDESDWEVEDSKAPAAARRAATKKGAATGRSNRASARMKHSKAAAAAAAAGDAAADSDAAAGDVGASAPKAKTRRSKTTAEGGVQKRKARKPSTAAADGSSKPKARKPAQRQNFKRHKTNAGGYGFKFMSKAAAKGGGKRFFRRVHNGKLLRARRQAPHMAGQGAEFLEGFAGGGGGRGKGRCFTCGQAGHWQEECPLLAARVAEQEAELAAWMRDNPDAEEAQRVAGGNGDAYRTTAAADTAAVGTGTGAGAGGVQGPAQAAAAAARTGRPLQHQRYPQQPKRVLAPPLSQAQLCELAGLAPDAPWAPERLTDEQLGSVLRGVWGHSGFRGQQLTLVRAALEGRSMLGVLPTGLGKSLTYQLPALLMQGLVVVVSPLLALMHDQVSRLPAGLPGAMLQASMDRQEVDEVLRAAESGQLRLLYVAPEKLGASHILSCLQRLPNLPLVCVDEAHCMAEWGEGFRPAYFRLGHLLVNVLRPRAILALTATAAPRTRNSIRTLLSLTEEQQVVESPLRDNLRLRVMHVSPGASLGGTVAAHMVQLLKSGEFCDVKSAVVYVTYKASAEGIAAQMMRAGITAAAYHGDMRMQQRETVQNAFLRGHLRVMVATVAFGMGMDKPDLEVVLHVNMPHSLEEYVQQVGRGGRDGRTAHCVLFLDDADYLKLRTLSHQRTAKRSSVEQFLRHVFIREDDAEQEDEGTAAAVGKGAKKRRKPKLAPSQHRALPLTSTSVELDLGEEVMESCLSFLQADPVEPYLAVLATVAETYDVRFHNTPPEELRKHHRVIDAILRAKTRKYAGTYKVHIPVLLSVEDRPPKELLDELSALAAAKELSVDSGRERALAWRLVRQPDDWDAMVDDVCARLDNVVSASVSRLDRCYETLAGAAIYSSAAAQEQHLRCAIEDYFMQEQPQEQGQGQEPEAGTTAAAAVEDPDDFAPGADELPWGARHPVQRPSKESLLRQLRATMHAAGPRARDLGPGRFHGLVLARMVAGLSSPAVPKSFWKGCREFGRMEAVDFKLVLAAAEQVVQEFWAGEAGSRLRTMA